MILPAITPGNWEALGWRVMGDGQQVAGCELMLRDPIERGEAETRANAKAIAAVPALLEALVGMLRVCPSERNGMRLAEYDAARAALRLAGATLVAPDEVL